MKNRVKIIFSMIIMIILIIGIYFLNSPDVRKALEGDYKALEVIDSNYFGNTDLVNDIIPLYFRIQPEVGEMGIQMYDRLYTKGKRQAINVYFQDAKDFAKAKVFTDPEANASLMARRNSLNEIYYSYKVRLFDKAGQFMGMKTFNVEKFLEDPVRIRHKFAADLSKKLAILLPLDVYFASVSVQDVNFSMDQAYEDYGIFFITEHIDKLFLRNHRLDDGAALYEADEFTMDYNNVSKAINNNLERRGVNDDSRLETVINEVKSSEDIQATISKYFDKDNLLDYMAYSLLIDREDPATEDYFLYSSRRDNLWYIFPSSYRDSFGNYRSVEWKRGIHKFYGNPLFEKIVQDPLLRSDLTKRVDLLYGVIKTLDLNKMVEDYRDVLMPSLSVMPDFIGLSSTLKDVEREMLNLPALIDQAYLAYQSSLVYPTPISMREESGRVSWSESISFVDSPITYTLEVSRQPSMMPLVLREEGLTEKMLDLNHLGPGIYYVRVMANDQQGYEQFAINRYSDPFGKDYHSIKQIVIP